MKSLIALQVLMLCILISCNDEQKSISKENLTITEDIVLGSDIDSMYKALKEKKILPGFFYTKMSFSDYSETNNYSLGIYYTDIFNLSEYRNSLINLNHYGFLYPIELTGTNKLLGMNILLVSTQEQLFTSPVKLSSPSVIQEVNELLLDEIENLFSKKYGKPVNRTTSSFYPVYHIEGNQIKEYGSAGAEAEIVSWETDYLTIDFFKGIKSYETEYDPITPQYQFWWTVGGEPKPVKPKFGNKFSHSMPYISYMLKDTTVKILKLEKKLNI
jgi:hypothetical protein